MARAAVSLAVILLAFAFFVSASSDPLTAVQPDHATAEEANNLPEQRGKDEEEAVDKAAGGRRGADATDGYLASLASPEEEGQKLESDWGKKKKLDNTDDSDSDSDSDSDTDSDDDDHSKIERKKKKHAAPGREGVPGGKKDDELPEAAIRV